MRSVCLALAVLLLLICSPFATAESWPPPTLEELLGAEVIAIGSFSEGEDGSVGFSCERVLKGDEAAARRLGGETSSHLDREEGLALHSRAMAARLANVVTLVDAGKPWIWFLSPGREPEVQPVELEEGYRALLAGKKPDLWFRLLQGLDPDLMWQAMEELAAAPEKGLVERLNRLALKGDTDVALMAIEVLGETGLLTADSEKIRQWMPAVPEAAPQPAPQEPFPPWTAEEELAFLLNQLTSQSQHGFVMESAGREVVERCFERGFAELRKRLAQEDVYNTDMVMDGIGHLRHPEVFEFLVEYLADLPLWHRTFLPGLVALGRQDAERSFDAIAEILESRFPSGPQTYPEETLRRAYSLMRDPRAAAALARLGGGEEEPDLPALKAEVAKEWPRRSREYRCWGNSCARGMQNFAGPARRTSALGEVARRDPAWLAAQALERMDSEWRAERQAAEEVFRQLTGRDFGFRAEALAGKRREPLEKLRAWWVANREKSREEWLLSYFREKGYAMERLWNPESIPVLSRALDGDFTTHRLAVEQISVIRGKFFTRFPINRGHRDQERMTIRVRAWLEFE